MKILFTICGRAGSKGIRNKNIKDFLGYPLPYYTLSAIELFQKRHTEMTSDVVLNTDSKELMKLCEKNSICKTHIIEREKSLGMDDVPKVAVIRNCLIEMEDRTKVHYDMVVDLDITSPLRKVGDIENAIRTKADSWYDVVFSVTDARRNPYFNMVKKNGNQYERVLSSQVNARQEAPEVYDMNASIYAYSPEFLYSGKNIYDGKCGIIKMYDTGVLDIDHDNDLELMQVIAKYLFECCKEFGEIRDNIRE